MGAFTSPGVRRHAPPCWFPLAHAEAISANDRLELLGMADIDQAAMEKAIKFYGDSVGFTDPLTMIDRLRPDLLCVATRTVGRAMIIDHAIASGVRALHVEKPLCNSLSELVALESLFASGDRFLTLGTVRRFMSPYRKAIEVARSGRLGRLVETQVNFGRAALYWTHPHSIDLLLQASGGAAVETVTAMLSGMEIDAEGPVVGSDPFVERAELTFADGSVGRITAHGGCDLILYCERGRVVVESDGRVAYVATTDGDNPYYERFEFETSVGPGGTLAPLLQLTRCLDGDEVALAENAKIRRDIFRGQRIMFAMVESSFRRRAIARLDELAEGLVVWARTGGRVA
jgi:scyllo-inositol 2-dehydrogenase (NAD+)